MLVHSISCSPCCANCVPFRASYNQFCWAKLGRAGLMLDHVDLKLGHVDFGLSWFTWRLARLMSSRLNENLFGIFKFGGPYSNPEAMCHVRIMLGHANPILGQGSFDLNTILFCSTASPSTVPVVLFSGHQFEWFACGHVGGSLQMALSPGQHMFAILWPKGAGPPCSESRWCSVVLPVQYLGFRLGLGLGLSKCWNHGFGLSSGNTYLHICSKLFGTYGKVSKYGSPKCSCCRWNLIAWSSGHVGPQIYSENPASTWSTSRESFFFFEPRDALAVPKHIQQFSNPVHMTMSDYVTHVVPFLTTRHLVQCWSILTSSCDSYKSYSDIYWYTFWHLPCCKLFSWTFNL